MATGTPQQPYDFLGYTTNVYGMPTRTQQQSPTSPTQPTQPQQPTQYTDPSNKPPGDWYFDGQKWVPQGQTAQNQTGTPQQIPNYFNYTPVQGQNPVSVNSWAAPQQVTAQGPTYTQQNMWMPTAGAPGTVNAQGVYTAGQLNSPTYQQQRMGAFQGPNFGGLDQQQMSALSNMLANGSLSPDVVNQMKGTQKDQSMLMAQQLQGQARNQLAARGISTLEGQGAGAMRDIEQQRNSDLLNQYRTTDIQAAMQNRQDMLNALGAAGNYQNSAFNRAYQGNAANLANMGFNSQEQLNAINTANQQFALQQGALQAQSGSMLGLAGLFNPLLASSAENAANRSLNAQQFNVNAGQQYGFQNANLNLNAQQFNAQLAQALGLANASNTMANNQLNANTYLGLSGQELQRMLGMAANAIQGQQVNNQNSQFYSNLDFQRQVQQFQQMLAQQQFGFSQQQWADQMGFNYNTLNSNNINSAWNWMNS